jgi:3-hydroxyacyl-CoA dehydrogenase/enoyl-CoA hydratase/3-hydroxybutyryl-CoA epimerase
LTSLGSPVNTMCLQWQDDLDAVTAQVVKDKDAIKGIVLASAKSTFFAGADLKGTMRLQPRTPARVRRDRAAPRRTSARWKRWASRWSAA